MRLYVCDPDKNTECEKTFCQEFCKHTTQKEYRVSPLKLLKSILNYRGGRRADTRKENMDA